MSGYDLIDIMSANLVYGNQTLCNYGVTFKSGGFQFCAR